MGTVHACEVRRGDQTRNILIDFGYQSQTLLNNMSVLNIDPTSFDALVLSHGHYDHFGGFIGFLSANKGKLKRDLPFFVGGEDCFCMRETDAGQYGALDRKAITDANLSLMMAEGPAVGPIMHLLPARSRRRVSRSRCDQAARKSALSTVSDVSRRRCQRQKIPAASFLMILSMRSVRTSLSKVRDWLC